MRVATWNVNGLRARLGFVLHWLHERQPDIVGLQELKLESGQCPVEEFREAGYEIAAHCQKSWNGVAILSRMPPEVINEGLPGQEEMGARLITARTEGIEFSTVYVPNGKTVEHEDYGRKLQWLDALAGHLETRHSPAEPFLLCGDFNVCPTPLDTWNEAALHGTIFHTEAERERLVRLARWGLKDLFREKFREQKAFSWWDYRGGAFHRGQGLRIDFLLGSPPLLARLRNVEIDREYRKKKDGLTPSDHAPVIADLD